VRTPPALPSTAMIVRLQFMSVVLWPPVLLLDLIFSQSKALDEM
jgi:hypothetical protein